MTRALARAFRAASKLPEPEQNALAEAIRSGIHVERAWHNPFAGGADALERLIDKVIAKHRIGRTRKINLRSV